MSETTNQTGKKTNDKTKQSGVNEKKEKNKQISVQENEPELLYESDSIFIYRQWCKGCGICIAFCPKKVLAAGPDGKPYIARPSDCIRCGMCDLRCPDFAITGLRIDQSGIKQF